MSNATGTNRALAGLPFTWTRDELVIAGRRHPATGHVPVLLQPHPLAPPTATDPGRYLVINSGVTFREEADVSNAWRNPKLPDWAVVDISEQPDGRAPGRVVTAGFCDEAWRIVAP